MAVITGVTGEVTSWANNTLLIDTNSAPATFTLDYVADEHDTTAFGATSAMTAIAGLPSWSGTISTRYDAAQIGNGGSVTYSSGHVVNVNGWSMEMTSDPKPVTALSASAKAYLPSLIRWAGQYTGYLDSSTAISGLGVDPPASATFAFDGTRSLAGAITVLSQSITSSPSEPNVYTQRYRGSGALTAAGASSFFSAGTVAIPTVGELVLQASTSRTFTGDAFWTSLSINCPVDGLVTLDIGFQGTGALTIG